LSDPELREKMQMAISIKHTEGEALGDAEELPETIPE
jgi:hypothetical protein